MFQTKILGIKKTNLQEARSTKTRYIACLMKYPSGSYGVYIQTEATLTKEQAQELADKINNNDKGVSDT